MSDISPTEAQVAHAAYDKMLAETRKFAAEQNKLASEAGHLDRQRVLAPFIAGAAVMGSAIAVLALVLRLLGVV